MRYLRCVGWLSVLVVVRGSYVSVEQVTQETFLDQFKQSRPTLNMDKPTDRLHRRAMGRAQ